VVHSKRILVVGDAPFLRDRLVGDLVYRGYDVRQCVGAAALEMMRGVRPALLILHFPATIAPERTLTSAVRGDPELSGTRILNVAPNADAALLRAAQEAGVDASVDSIEPARVLREVRQLIGPAVDP
jgi:CheY-like chemotaxis protein